MKHVVIYVGHLYKPFWTKKSLTGLAGGVREGPNIAKYGPRFWLLSPLEAPKWVQDPGNGLKSIRGSWGIIWGPFPSMCLMYVIEYYLIFERVWYKKKSLTKYGENIAKGTTDPGVDFFDQ